MKKAITCTTSFLALTALAGCYAQIEDTDVIYTSTAVCSPACTGNNTSLTLVSLFIPPFPVDLGDSGVLTSSESKQGPITFNGSLILNTGTVNMTTPANGDFSGIRMVDLRVRTNSTDPCNVVSDTCKSIASYDSTRDGPATRTLVVKGAGVNLLDLANSTPTTGGTQHKVITFIAKAVGNAPAPATWNADVDFNMALKARGSFP